MRSELVSQEKNRIEIKVEFEASEFEAELKKVYNNISQRANVPGFRKGHVPRKTIEMRFGRDAIHDEAIENILNQNLSEIMKDYDIEPLFAPRLKNKGAVIEGQPVSVNLLVEARPEINLPELGDIEVERLIPVVDDAMIDFMIDKLRDSQAKIETVEHDAIVRDDSIITVEFSIADINDEGEEISRSKKSEMATVNMQNLPSEEFREPLAGKKVGDLADVVIKSQLIDKNADSSRYETELAENTAETTLAHPTDEISKSPRSISRHYEMRIVEIGEKVLPELTPEFFKFCMGFDCPTEEEFRDAIAERMLKKMQYESEADAQARALNIMANMSGFEVPNSLIFRERERIRALDEKNTRDRYNMGFKEFLSISGLKYEDYENRITVGAWETVRNMLVTSEIARKFEIDVEPSDLDEWIRDTAKREELDAELMKKEYFKNKDNVNLLVDKVLSDKAVKFLMDNVKINDVSELTQPVVISEEPEETDKAEEVEKLEETENTENISNSGDI